MLIKEFKKDKNCGIIENLILRFSFKSHKETMYILLEMQRLFGPIEQRSQKNQKKSEKEKNYE